MKKHIDCPPYFINGVHRITICVVGAGGTGSLLLTKLARLHHALVQLDHPGLHVTLIDDDKVEAHNVGRQMFTNYDIGKHKSETLIYKVNHAYGMDWDSSTSRFNEKQQLNCNITFVCVDNVLSRKLIYREFFYKRKGRDTYKKYFLIDCGNARDYGQVILTDQEKTLKCLEDFADLKEQDTKEQQGAGCSYFDRLQEQDLFINDDVSTYAIRILKELLFKKRLDYQGFFFNSNNCETVKIPIT